MTEEDAASVDAPEVDRQRVRPRWSIGDPGRSAVEVVAGFPVGSPDVPSVAVDSAVGLGLEIRAASVRGLAHRHRGEPRQDAYSLGGSKAEQTLILTVCDGVGSLGLSHEAAGLVSRLVPGVVGEVTELDGTPPWDEVFSRVSATLTSLVTESAAPLMATTVVCAVLRGGPGTWRLDVGWIGDSSAALLRADRWTHLGAQPPSDSLDEPVARRTRALPSTSVSAHHAVSTLEAGDAFFVMSDGVGDALGRGRGEVGQTLAQWWRRPPDPLEFAAQVDFARRGFVDDRTVVGVWCPSDPEDPPARADLGVNGSRHGGYPQTDDTPAAAPPPAGDDGRRGEDPQP